MINGKNIPVTTTQQTLDIRSLSDGGYLNLKAVDCDVYYLINQNATIRTSSSTITTTDADDTELTYAVADESLFRIGESINVLTSAGAFKGVVKVTASDTEEITVSKKTTFTLESGDKLQLFSDPFIPDGDSVDILTGGISSLRLKGSATGSLLATAITSALKKKI